MFPYHVEAFIHLRDNAKPRTQRDAADLAAVRAPMPPSKAHLKRLARHRQDIQFLENPRPYPEPRQSMVQLEFHKRVIAELGGSSTIAPMPPEKLAPRASGAHLNDPTFLPRLHEARVRLARKLPAVDHYHLMLDRIAVQNRFKGK